jgi:hypothetical protein
MQLTNKGVQKKKFFKKCHYLPRKSNSERDKKINSEVLRLFYLDFQTFSVIDDGGFCQFVKSLNTSYEFFYFAFITTDAITILFCVS